MVTDRRGFLAAIVGVLLAGRGALEKLRELTRERYEDWHATPVNFMKSTTMHSISPDVEAMWDASLYDHEGGVLTYSKLLKVERQFRRRPGRIVNLTEQ